MTTTTAVIVNILLGIGIVGALALVIRLAHRIPHGERAETLHPSQPLTLAVLTVETEHEQLVRAA
ncbi:MAG TPA: hypothetical protein VGN27_13720 [Gaiellaceae bacterium]|jgi:hypothetical protein|nr:hypothetical protein [Gaiellaceae bacterium]